MSHWTAFQTQYRPYPLGAVPQKENRRFCGEDKSGISLWKNQRIHSMPFGISRLNQIPALSGDFIEF